MEEPQLSQAEIWDDSELVDSWNEALEEYKKYHSLAAKGEKVKIHPEQINDKESPVNGDPPPTVTSKPEIQEVAERDETPLEPATTAGAAKSRILDTPTIASTAPAVPTLPQQVLSTVPHEDLKNLMMSWYYAGYYTGLYEGKQQGYASAMQRHAG